MRRANVLFVQHHFLKAIKGNKNVGELFASISRKGFYAPYAGRKPNLIGIFN